MSIRLICGATYTRVYTVVVKWLVSLILHVGLRGLSRGMMGSASMIGAPLHVFRSVWEKVKPNFSSDFKTQTFFEDLSFD